MLTCAFVTNGTTPRTRRTNTANPRLFIQQWYKPAKNPQWQYSLFVETENVSLKGIFERKPLSSRFMRKRGEFGDELSAARVPAQEHILGPPKKYAMDGFRCLVAQKRALVADPQRLFVAATQGIGERKYFTPLFFFLHIKTLGLLGIFLYSLPRQRIQFPLENEKQLFRLRHLRQRRKKYVPHFFVGGYAVKNDGAFASEHSPSRYR